VRIRSGRRHSRSRQHSRDLLEIVSRSVLKISRRSQEDLEIASPNLETNLEIGSLISRHCLRLGPHTKGSAGDSLTCCYFDVEFSPVCPLIVTCDFYRSIPTIWKVKYSALSFDLDHIKRHLIGHYFTNRWFPLLVQ
jgi:hypothetical protein